MKEEYSEVISDSAEQKIKKEVKLDLYSYLKADLPAGINTPNLEIMQAVIQQTKREVLTQLTAMDGWPKEQIIINAALNDERDLAFNQAVTAANSCVNKLLEELKQ